MPRTIFSPFDGVITVLTLDDIDESTRKALLKELETDFQISTESNPARWDCDSASPIEDILNAAKEVRRV